MWQCFVLYKCGLLPLSFFALPKFPIHSAELLCCSLGYEHQPNALVWKSSFYISFTCLPFFLMVALQSLFFLAKTFLGPVSRKDCISMFLSFLIHELSVQQHAFKWLAILVDFVSILGTSSYLWLWFRN